MNKDYSIELMESHGIKPTANRIVVVNALLKCDRPMSLSELETKILTIDKSGIFRTLNLFKEHHFVHVIEDGGGAGARYELCRSRHGDFDDDEHPHFHCEACGRTFCLEDTSVPCVDLPEGFQPATVSLLVRGLCPDCAKR